MSVLGFQPLLKRLIPVGLVTIILTGCEQREPLTLGALATEPAREMSQQLANELNNHFLITTQSFDSPAQLIVALQASEVDLAIIEEPPQPLPDLQVLRSMFPSVLHVLSKPDLLTPTNSKPRSIANAVRGHSVYAGPPGGAGHALLQLLVDQGIFPPREEFKLFESVFDGDSDIYIVFGGILSQNALERLKGYKLVSLGAVSELGKGSWAEGVALRSPNIQPFVIPGGLYPGIADDATLSLSVQSLLVTHPKLSVQAAYKVLATVDELMAGLRSIYSLAGRSPQASDEISFNLPTHKGGLRYQQREKPGFFERYAELLAFSITLALALSSLLVALLRLRKQAKKDRIDIYFEELLKFRASLLAGESERQEISQKTIELQHRVTGLVSDERISADSAYVGFLALSNQVLKECRQHE